ncbi:MAG: putative non-ribosomal peptide synthetase module [Phormidium sp. OSCR]|nr:MAG: putative non-ribosomal peptide synthetase module [Phormidium sp. OSCR]
MNSSHSPRTLPCPDPSQSLDSNIYPSVLDQFCHNVARVPQQIALVDRHKQWTYRDLDESSSQLAKQLRDQGLGAGDAIAIYAHRSASLVWALLAILKLKATFIILDSAYPGSRLQTCCHLSQPKGLIHLSHAGSQAEELPRELQEFIDVRDVCYLHLPAIPNLSLNDSNDLSEAESIIEKPPTHQPTHQSTYNDDIAYIAFTSGSTGQPKGIVGTHQPLAHFIDWHCRHFNLQECDRFVLLSGLAHDPLLRDIFTPLWLGASLSIPDQDILETSGKLCQWMQQQEITIAHLTPAMGLLLSQGTSPQAHSELIPSLRYLFWGGDVLTQADISRSKQLSKQVTNVNFYGATETPQAMGYYIVPDGCDVVSKKLPIGQGIDGVQLLIIKEDGTLAVDGDRGEICIRTPYLARGYLNDASLTESKFVANPFREPSSQDSCDRIYKTGDLGRYLADGNIEILGRIDNQIKLRGFRIELSEIESVLGQHPDIERAVVVLQSSSMGSKMGSNQTDSRALTEHLVAYCLTRENMVIAPGDLRQFLTDKLPYYMIPQAFVAIPEFPLTPNGKIDRQALSQFEHSPQITATYQAPENDLEQQLVDIWQTWLKQERIGRQDNFFDLGGNSLLAIGLCRDIETALNRSIPISALFQHPTIQDFAKLLQDAPDDLQESSLITIQGKGRKTPIFAVHVLGKGLQYYRPLVKYLGENQPLYGLSFNLLDDAEGSSKGSSKGIKELSEIYIKDLKTLQPHGPYYLLGVSIGGRVAFEMAQQLQAQGEDVGLLGLIDTTARTGVKHLPPSSRVSGHWGKFKQEGFSYITHKLKSRFGRIQYRLKAIRAEIYQRFGQQVPDDLKSIANLETNIKIKKQHFPQPYSGKVTLFRAMGRQAEVGTEIDPQYGWGDLAVGGLEIYDIPGDHLLMLQEPNVQVLAEKIQELLEPSKTVQEEQLNPPSHDGVDAT